MTENTSSTNEISIKKNAKTVSCYCSRIRLNKNYWRNGWNYSTRQKSKRKLDFKYVFYSLNQLIVKEVFKVNRYQL